MVERFIEEAYDVGTDEYRQYMQRMTPGQGDKKWNKTRSSNQLLLVLTMMGRK